MRRVVLVAGLAAVLGLGALVATLSSAGHGLDLARASAAPGAGVTGAPTGSEAAPSPGGSANGARPPTSLVRTTVPALLDRPGIREQLQAVLEAGCLELAAPGAAASILLPDGRQWIGTAGVADLASGRPLTPSTPFAVASISKTFLAAEILALVEEGRVTLDAAVAPSLPGVLVGGKPIDPRITVQQLLDHTSGLRDYLVDPRLDRAVRADPTRRWTVVKALAYAGRPVAAPGVRYFYSNTNYALLGLLAERITGRTLAAEYRARFFGPLGLHSAFYQGVEAPVSELPTAYRYTSTALGATPIDTTDGTGIRPFTAITTAAGPAGSVAASPADLVRWVEALYTGGVLDPVTVAAMVGDARTVAALKLGSSYGLGVQVLTIDGRVSYGHTGRLVGMRSVVRWFPDAGIAIAVTTNESRFDPTVILTGLLAVILPQTGRAHVGGV